MEKEITSLKFKRLSPEEKAKRGILGRLYGPVASCAEATRNGRKYTEELWEKLFNSDLIKERFANGGIFGELCHPDYEEVDIEKVACVMPEPPKKDASGKLMGYVDILDTPAGKVAYQLAKYGYRFGISSRGTGDLIDGIDGQEVDPDTYQLNAFDLVEIPAVESARLQFVESLETKTLYNKTLKESLNDMVSKATNKDKIAMIESIDKMGIDLGDEEEPVEEHIQKLRATQLDEGKVKDAIKKAADFVFKDHTWDDFEDAPEEIDTDVPESLEKLYNYLDNVEEDDQEAFLREFYGLSEDDAMKLLAEYDQDRYDKDAASDPDHFMKVVRGEKGFIGKKNESISESHINEAPEQDGAWYGPRTDYTVKIQKVKPGTRVHNKLENADYTTNEQKCYVITGTVGEQWPVDAKKVQQKYICDLQALESGKPVDAKINPEAVKGDKGYFTVCKQPIEVKTDWGDVLHAEPGDMLRSNGPGQEPDRVVDPGVFKTTYQKLNESISESCGDKDDVKEEVVNDKSDEFAAELQEALSKNKKLVKDNLSLQEKLSVCTAKEAKLEEELKKYKASTAHLSETAKKVRPLKRDLNSLTEELEKKDSILKANKTRFNELVDTANEAIAKLEESNKVNKNLKNKVKNLNEQLEATQVKVDNSQALVKKYQKALRESRDALVQAKADAYGIEKDDILSNLNESYNLKQLNSVCEELQDRKRNLSKLPFRVNSTSKMQIKEAKETITGRDSYMNDDDYVSDSLLDMLK